MTENVPVPAPAANTNTVSRETAERLALYAGLLRKWQPAINLVSPSTLAEAESRHFADSAQLWPLVPAATRRLVDLGSGAGFPGLVLAVLGVSDVHLIESDVRKATFLREVARVTHTAVTVHASRIDKIPPLNADVITARALAPLPALLAWAVPHLAPGGLCLFLKGRQADEELRAAMEAGWSFGLEKIPSRLEADAVILKLHSPQRAQP